MKSWVPDGITEPQNRPWNCQMPDFVMNQLIRTCMLSHSVASDSLRPHGLKLTRLLCPRDSPSRNTEVGCHVFFQGIFPTHGQNYISWCSPWPRPPGASQWWTESPRSLYLKKKTKTKKKLHLLRLLSPGLAGWFFTTEPQWIHICIILMTVIQNLLTSNWHSRWFTISA